MTQGARIKAIRISLGLTLEKFGERLGVGKTAISKLEKDERNLTDQMARSICREFHINEAWLRAGSGPMQLPVQDEVMAALSDLAEKDTPFYDLLKKLLLAYQRSDASSKKAIDQFLLDLPMEKETSCRDKVCVDIPQLSRLSIDEKVALYRQELEREEKAGVRSKA